MPPAATYEQRRGGVLKKILRPPPELRRIRGLRWKSSSCPRTDVSKKVEGRAFCDSIKFGVFEKRRWVWNERPASKPRSAMEREIPPFRETITCHEAGKAKLLEIQFL